MNDLQCHTRDCKFQWVQVHLNSDTFEKVVVLLRHSGKNPLWRSKKGNSLRVEEVRICKLFEVTIYDPLNSQEQRHQFIELAQNWSLFCMISRKCLQCKNILITKRKIIIHLISNTLLIEFHLFFTREDSRETLMKT